MQYLYSYTVLDSYTALDIHTPMLQRRTCSDSIQVNDAVQILFGYMLIT